MEATTYTVRFPDFYMMVEAMTDAKGNFYLGANGNSMYLTYVSAEEDFTVCRRIGLQQNKLSASWVKTLVNYRRVKMFVDGIKRLSPSHFGSMQYTINFVHDDRGVSLVAKHGDEVLGSSYITMTQTNFMASLVPDWSDTVEYDLNSKPIPLHLILPHITPTAMKYKELPLRTFKYKDHPSWVGFSVDGEFTGAFKVTS